MQRKGGNCYGKVSKALSVHRGAAVTRMQRCECQRGGDKQGVWGESQGWRWNVRVLCAILLGARHAKQLLVHASPCGDP